MKAAGEKVLPKKVIQEVRKYRSFAGIERSLYLKMKVLNGIGLANPKRLRPPKGARSFVFVCFGNIMRSPMCEALMNRALAAVPDKGITVTSAGNQVRLRVERRMSGRLQRRGNWAFLWKTTAPNC